MPHITREIKTAIRQGIRLLNTGDESTLQKLIGEPWIAIEKPERLLIGKEFSNTHEEFGLIATRKKSNNHRLYKKQ